VRCTQSDPIMKVARVEADNLCSVSRGRQECQHLALHVLRAVLFLPPHPHVRASARPSGHAGRRSPPPRIPPVAANDSAAKHASWSMPCAIILSKAMGSHNRWATLGARLQCNYVHNWSKRYREKCGASWSRARASCSRSRTRSSWPRIRPTARFSLPHRSY